MSATVHGVDHLSGATALGVDRKVSDPWVQDLLLRVVNRMGRRTLGAWRAFLTSSTAWVVNPMGEKSTVRRCQPHGLSTPWGLVCTANIVNRMGVTSVLNPMGEKLTVRRSDASQPHGSSAPWGEHVSITTSSAWVLGCTTLESFYV